MALLSLEKCCDSICSDSKTLKPKELIRAHKEIDRVQAGKHPSGNKQRNAKKKA